MTRWRPDVPMPARVGALPQTQEGIPITYTVAWTSEQEVEVHPDPILTPLGLEHAPAIFSSGRPGDGQPKLGLADASRQRRSSVLGLCQVCAELIPEPTPDLPRWLCDLRIADQVIRLDRVVPLIVDSWTCESCLAYALKTCPGLTRRTGLVVLRVRAYSLIATVERPSVITAARLPYGPIGYVKIAPTDYDELPSLMAQTSHRIESA